MNSCISNTFLFMLLDVSVLGRDLLCAEIFSSFKLSGFRKIVSSNAGNVLVLEDNW